MPNVIEFSAISVSKLDRLFVIVNNLAPYIYNYVVSFYISGP
jgi:hypothetical protein